MFLGISSYNHESAVALINRSGILIDYCKEESLSRIKGEKSFPKRALKRIIEIITEILTAERLSRLMNEKSHLLRRKKS